MSQTHVVLCVDRLYVRPASVTIASLLEATSSARRICIHVIAHDISKHDALMLRALHPNVNIHPVDISLDTKARFRPESHLSAATMLRLSLGSVLPPSVEEVIYLDADVMVKGDICELGGTFADNGIAAVRDQLMPHRSVCAHRGDEPTLAQNCQYFNAGLLVINLTSWRQYEAEKRIGRALLDPRFDLKYYDQDVLNLVYCGNWTPLDPRWNHLMGGLTHQAPTEEEKLRLAEAKLLHFNGPFKPWNGWHGDPEVVEQYHLLAQKVDWNG